MRVAQRFRNTGTSYVEAVYVLPLPDDAAVDRLSMKIGERIIEGEIHERQQAERIYGEARAAGQRASLVRQTSANLFTTAVANIAPGEHDRHHDRVPADGALRRRRVQPARAADVDAALRRAGYAGGPGRAGVGDPARGATSDRGMAAAPPFGGYEARRSTPRHEAYVHAVLAPGMPLEWLGSRSHEVRSVRQQGPAWTAARDAQRGNGAAAAGVLVQPPPADLYVSIPWRRACRWTATS